MYVRTGIDAYIAVQGEHLGIPENKRTKFVRLFSHIYRELLLYKIKWTFCPAPTEPKSSVHFEHLIISLITETTVLSKSSYQNDMLPIIETLK